MTRAAKPTCYRACSDPIDEYPALELLLPDQLDNAGPAVTNPADGTVVARIRRDDVAAITDAAPFGGVKESDFGRGGASHDLADYMNTIPPEG